MPMFPSAPSPSATPGALKDARVRFRSVAERLKPLIPDLEQAVRLYGDKEWEHLTEQLKDLHDRCVRADQHIGEGLKKGFPL